eukprot:365488-Chlamydomonas_euryale.AAC.4
MPRTLPPGQGAEVPKPASALRSLKKRPAALRARTNGFALSTRSVRSAGWLREGCTCSLAVRAVRVALCGSIGTVGTAVWREVVWAHPPFRLWRHGPCSEGATEVWPAEDGGTAPVRRPISGFNPRHSPHPPLSCQGSGRDNKRSDGGKKKWGRGGRDGGRALTPLLMRRCPLANAHAFSLGPDLHAAPGNRPPDPFATATHRVHTPRSTKRNPTANRPTQPDPLKGIGPPRLAAAVGTSCSWPTVYRPATQVAVREMHASVAEL